MALVNKVTKLSTLVDLHHLNALKSLIGVSLRAAACSSSASSSPSRWDLVSSVCLERVPVVTRDLNELEYRFQKLQFTIEFESSLKSDHEKRKEQDRIHAELLKKGDLSDVDMDQTTKATAQDFEDACQDELAKSQLASRVSDESQPTASLQRKLDQHLLMLVKQKVGDKAQWMLPQQTRAEGETMRQTAERALKASCGDQVKALFLGNAPWGFYKYKYPRTIRDERGPQGAKVFFFKAVYQSGDLECKEVQWLTKTEAAKNLPEEYFKSIDQFLIHDA